MRPSEKTWSHLPHSKSRPNEKPVIVRPRSPTISKSEWSYFMSDFITKVLSNTGGICTASIPGDEPFCWKKRTLCPVGPKSSRVYSRSIAQEIQSTVFPVQWTILTHYKSTHLQDKEIVQCIEKGHVSSKMSSPTTSGIFYTQLLEPIHLMLQGKGTRGEVVRKANNPVSTFFWMMIRDENYFHKFNLISLRNQCQSSVENIQLHTET